MSRKITIQTKYNNPEAVEAALKELKCAYTRTKDHYFKVTNGQLDYKMDGAEVERFRYTGVTIDTNAESCSFDEDCTSAKAFVEGPLKQAYSNHTFLLNASEDGDIIENSYTVGDEIPYIEGYGGKLSQGDIVYVSTKPMYG